MQTASWLSPLLPRLPVGAQLGRVCSWEVYSSDTGAQQRQSRFLQRLTYTRGQMLGKGVAMLSPVSPLDSAPLSPSFQASHPRLGASSPAGLPLR